VHAMTDSTSAVHRNNGIPISWPILPNALHHGSNSDWPGSSFGSGESWANVTPQLMQENINLIKLIGKLQGSVVRIDNEIE
jgi:hypothetical protein